MKRNLPRTRTGMSPKAKERVISSDEDYSDSSEEIREIVRDVDDMYLEDEEGSDEALRWIEENKECPYDRDQHGALCTGCYVRTLKPPNSPIRIGQYDVGIHPYSPRDSALTPPHIKEVLFELLGWGWDEVTDPTPLRRRDDEQFVDALTNDSVWGPKNFLNPPFSNVCAFLVRAKELFVSNLGYETVLIFPFSKLGRHYMFNVLQEVGPFIQMSWIFQAQIGFGHIPRKETKFRFKNALSEEIVCIYFGRTEFEDVPRTLQFRGPKSLARYYNNCLKQSKLTLDQCWRNRSRHGRDVRVIIEEIYPVILFKPTDETSPISENSDTCPDECVFDSIDTSIQITPHPPSQNIRDFFQAIGTLLEWKTLNDVLHACHGLFNPLYNLDSFANTGNCWSHNNIFFLNDTLTWGAGNQLVHTKQQVKQKVNNQFEMVVNQSSKGHNIALVVNPKTIDVKDFLDQAIAVSMASWTVTAQVVKDKFPNCYYVLYFGPETSTGSILIGSYYFTRIK